MLVRLARSLVVVLLAALVLGTGAAGYEKDPYIVKVTGPRGEVPCDRTVELTATVITSDTRKPARQQIVVWKVADGSDADRLRPARTKTNSEGRTKVDLYIAKARGHRRIVASAASVPGSVTIDVACVLPTPTPAPTPKATRRPDRTPRPTHTPTPSAAPRLGALTVAHPTADLAGMAPLLVVQGQGFFTDAGFDGVSLVHAADGLAALADGSADAAVVGLDAALGAIASGQPLDILTGYRNYRLLLMGAAEGVTSAADLAGRSIILPPAGTPDRDLLVAALLEAGWDVENAGAQIVEADGDPETAAQALLEGEVALAPILNRHRLPLDGAGGTVILDQREYGQDVLVAPSALRADAPAVVQGLQEAVIRALAMMSDPATDELLYAAADAAGVPLGDAVTNGWRLDLEDYRPLDGGLGLPELGGGLEELQDHLAARGLVVPALADHLAVASLNAIQAGLGLAPNPVLPALPAPTTSELTVGIADGPLVDRAPFLLAAASGAFSDAGFTDVALAPVADPVAALQDGSVAVAVVSLGDAQAGAAEGTGLSIIAGHATSGADGGAPTVLVADTERIDSDTLTAFLAAYLRGTGAILGADALTIATDQAGGASEGDVAGWDADILRFAPYDGRLPEGEVTGTDLGPLAAARRALGMADPA